MNVSDAIDVPAGVLAVTSELFPGNVSARIVHDPEYPDDTGTIVIDAVAAGEIKEIEARRLVWHRRIAPFKPAVQIWSLSLTYLE